MQFVLIHHNLSVTALQISMADIIAYAGLETPVPPDSQAKVLAKCPKLKALLARVAGDKKLAAYLAKRKSTVF